MKHKTFMLFELFLVVFAFYAMLKYTGNLRLFVPFVCLVTVLVAGKVETSLTDRSSKEDRQGNDRGKEDKKKTTFQLLDRLLKSKNVLLLTDAINYLMQDLGMAVSPSPDHPSIDRLVRIPDMQVTIGVKILADVGELNENWDKWEEVSDFDLGKGGSQRLLIIGSNCIKGPGDRQQRYKDFSTDTQKLLSARQVVAMTTLTLYKIYLLCKRKKLDLKTIFHLIKHHPGGVFQLEHYTKRSNQAA
ncbi:MAG: hypothetical protein JSU78_02100 [Deltaproteobacteria bacterium]|jgi:hypothetical protein|nr:MAG: hypothetical protein JSU78_02100 [Deltaproteobacteria bacterium]